MGIEILLFIFGMKENCSIFNETRVLDGGLSSVLGVKAEECNPEFGTPHVPGKIAS